MSNPADPKLFAFASGYETSTGGVKSHQNGMTKTEYFAAQALQGLCANASITELGTSPDLIAEVARQFGQALSRQFS